MDSTDSAYIAQQDEERRKAEIRRLHEAAPGLRNIEKLRFIAGAAGVKVITVRIWLLKTENQRPPSQRSIDLIKRELVKHGTNL